MDTIEKVYCTGHDNNDALVAALASKNNCDPMAMAAMMNQNDYMNNPFARLERFHLTYNCGVLDVVFDDTTVL